MAENRVSAMARGGGRRRSRRNKARVRLVVAICRLERARVKGPLQWPKAKNNNKANRRNAEAGKECSRRRKPWQGAFSVNASSAKPLSGQ